MTAWDELADLLADPGDVCSPAGQTRLYDALVISPSGDEPQGERAARLAAALATVDRAWLAGLGEDPVRSREDIDRAVDRCSRLRAAGGRSILPLRYARVELCTFFGERTDALEQLRVARLFSFDGVDVGAALAAARMHDDFSGIIRTTSGVARRPEADPVGTARKLAASLLPLLAQRRRVEAEDAFMSLHWLEVPGSLRARVWGDELEYLGLSGQWERGLALLRHTDLTGAGEELTAWGMLSTAIGASLVLREANRAGYGSNALGSSISWSTSWGASLSVTGWDTVVHAYDAVTAFARAIGVRFDKRNGNNGVSYRVESRMAGEAAGLAGRSYGTVTGTAVDEDRLDKRGALLAEVDELLVLARGYGLSSVHERARPRPSAGRLSSPPTTPSWRASSTCGSPSPDSCWRWVRSSVPNASPSTPPSCACRRGGSNWRARAWPPPRGRRTPAATMRQRGITGSACAGRWGIGGRRGSASDSPS